jgi:hypothetical protein
MLKTVAEVSPRLVAFILALHLSLSRPQVRHVTQVADALITTVRSKMLFGLYRHIVGDPCPKAAADTFHEASLGTSRSTACFCGWALSGWWRWSLGW